MEFPEVKKAIRHAEEKLGDHGRVLIRYSGTEPLLRVMLEGQDKIEISELAEEIAEAIDSHIGDNEKGG